MNWLTELTWWQITLIIIALVWVGGFLYHLDVYFSSAIEATDQKLFWAFVIVCYFFLVYPWILWKVFKMLKQVKLQPQQRTKRSI